MVAKENFDNLDAIVCALYECMSFAPHGLPNYERCKNLFCPGASIMPPSDDSIPASAVSVDEFFETSKIAIENSEELQSRGLSETELHRQVHEFGSVAQVFSTYESRVSFEDRVAIGRGVNSLSLVFQEARWWILSLSWEDESPELQVPDNLLP